MWILFLIQETLESSLQKLHRSLTDEQRSACLKRYDDPDRDAENFTPGERPGLLIAKLTDEQFRMLDDSIRRFLSEEGYKEAMAVAKQSHRREGLKAYYLNFFGDPAKDREWAFRVSEHHLTLVHVESDPARFGPVLLGANPPSLWREQEEKGLACFAKLADEERKKGVLRGSAESGSALGDRGIALEELSTEAREAARAMLEARLRIFSEAQQAKLRKILEGKKLRLAFFGDASKRCADGGRGDWKIEGPGFLCDFETSRGHIHMTLRAGK
jgi:hypothetical protein